MSVKLSELREPRLDVNEPRLEAREPRLLLEDMVRVLAERLGRETRENTSYITLTLQNKISYLGHLHTAVILQL